MALRFRMQKMNTHWSENESSWNCILTIETNESACLRKSVVPHARSPVIPTETKGVFALWQRQSFEYRPVVHGQQVLHIWPFCANNDRSPWLCYVLCRSQQSSAFFLFVLIYVVFTGQSHLSCRMLPSIDRSWEYFITFNGWNRCVMFWCTY